MNFFEVPRHPTTELDRKQLTPDLFDPDVLDESLLSDSAMISPTAGDRRDSFATTSTPFFSPQSATLSWDESFPVTSSTTLPDRHASVSSHFGEIGASTNPFHNTAWVFERSDSRTPVAPAVYGPFDGDFDSTSTPFSSAASNAAVFGNLPLLSNVRPAAIMPPTAGATPLPASPAPPKEWMGLAERENPAANRVPKRIRQSSPPSSLSPGYIRRDGVRKKNARFDIPPERSLANIDQLISNSSNDDEIKELKQQKRLLRNRQAALDSRQRKKKHTEELEEEKKHFTEHNHHLETELKTLRAMVDSLSLEKAEIESQAMQLSEQVHDLNWKNEKIIEEHTLESGDLRKKIAHLTEQLESSPVSVPSQGGFSEFTDFTDLDGLAMGNDWENNFIFVPDTLGSERQPTPLKPSGNETTLVIAPRRKDLTGVATVSDDSDKPVASGLLLMLLLYGAFVASNSSTSPSPPIPRVPDEVRHASTAILNTVLKESDSSTQQGATRAMSGMEPAPSVAAWMQPNNKPQVAGNTLFSISSGINPSSLDALSTQLMTPSKEQEAEAAFGMTPAQYNSVHNGEYTRRHYTATEDDGTMSTGRKNLADALRVMQERARGESAAQVYTRSLLWDRIPSEVVMEFRKMVAESGAESDDK